LSHSSLGRRLEPAIGHQVRRPGPSETPDTPDERLDALARRIALHVESLAPQGRVHCLDIGFGDPSLAEAVQQCVPRARLHHVDALRSAAAGMLPYEDGEFDVALVCDVLHRAPEGAGPLLAEAARVARHVLVEVPKLHFTRASFVAIAAQERLVISALDCGLDLYQRGPGAGALQPEWQFIAVLTRRAYKKQATPSKV
jgi:hypothetical protein